ncbi:L-seryl-tRNA selenium transferase [Lactococcus hodotermopsidis]|uniref:L-seryl-tRNA selenium transferase n=1 Tax=Pseudolactococcus hodotermopsidis TaxID=2709157 RepID=A0A6A0BFU4_9LACT|nr:DgaE family pyridoxal phosphate-dependent ammonia lyase [Lactococcus hodotermopsidis]GFH43141.1 L-seryl-tRNA selenium transferase [Lactococcus hodotermopsidis]
MQIHEKFNLKKVINASGKMTILGVSKISDKVAAAQKEAGQTFFEMTDLTVKTGQYIAKLLGVENATVVASASSGIALATAGVIGQGDMYHAYHHLTDRIVKREIIIPKGHNVNYGTGVEVMVTLGGGQLVEAGWANECTAEQVEIEITDKTAALLYIKSHHTVQKSMLTIRQMSAIAKKYALPLIVDAAAEEDLETYYAQGADLVIYSGAKAIEAPSSAVVIGRNPYIPWIQLQNKGIGRAMKIGKDNIIGFVTALEAYLANGSESGAHMIARLTPFIAEINGISGLSAKQVQDAAGRDIYRASVKVDTDKKTASQVIDELKQGDLAVYTREYQANNGIIEFDVRAVDHAEMTAIVAKLQAIMES